VTALRLTASARRDVANALAQSEEQFGRAARQRYRLLLEPALDDLAQDPRRPGVRADAHLPADHRLYPVRLSRARPAPADRVGHPRHVVVFRLDGPTVEVLRLLHEAMDLPRHLPPGRDEGWGATGVRSPFPLDGGRVGDGGAPPAPTCPHAT